MSRGSGNNGSGPCGACKFLRRKCLKGCVFAPYFDSEQGTAHFAAVHRVFGASNASKLLLRIPAHHRNDAVLTLCYEAMARVRDPVYGCVSHILSLQQQVRSLQVELAYIQTILQRLSALSQAPQSPKTSLQTSSSTSEMPLNSNISTHFDHIQLHPQQLTSDLRSSILDISDDHELNELELHALTRELL